MSLFQLRDALENDCNSASRQRCAMPMAALAGSEVFQLRRPSTVGLNAAAPATSKPTV
jgi:hypothetical protein